MAINLRWDNTQRRDLKKVVFGMTIDNLHKNIKSHEARGWVIASEVKKHGYGFACLMKFHSKE